MKFILRKSLVFHVVFCRSLFVLFLLVILSVFYTCFFPILVYLQTFLRSVFPMHLATIVVMLLTNFAFLYSHIRNSIIYCFRATRHTWKGSVTMTGRTRTNRNILCNPKRIETSLVEQELLTLPEHLSSSPVLSGVRVTRSLVLCVYFVDRCLPFCPLLLAIIFSCSSIYRFW